MKITEQLLHLNRQWHIPIASQSRRQQVQQLCIEDRVRWITLVNSCCSNYTTKYASVAGSMQSQTVKAKSLAPMLQNLFLRRLYKKVLKVMLNQDGKSM